MEPEEKKPEEQTPPKHTSHTYEDDLARAMDATDATVVQQMLSEGREREQNAIDERARRIQKRWYRLGAIVLLLATSVSLVYSLYYYERLTVPAQHTPSVGVFPSTKPIIAGETDIRKVVDLLKSDATLDDNKPTLALLVNDESNLTLLSPSEIFSFFEAGASEPFLASFGIVRLGVMHTANENIPFVIASINNAEIASKELLIAENQLLRMFYRPLGIDLAQFAEVIGREFTGEYMYNIPVRALRYDTPENPRNLLFFYARATDQIVVFTTKPEVLKAIYDSLIRQQQ